MEYKGVQSPSRNFTEMAGKNYTQMEGDSRSKKEETYSYSLLNFGDILQPSWVRCPVCNCDEMDRFLLDYGLNFLLPIGLFLWVVLGVFI
jgi:hypothetical protein